MASMNGKATDKSGAITAQERARIDASVRGLEQAPSTRQQLGANVNWKQLQDQLGQPFDNEMISLPKRKLMARDPMFAFGLHYTKLPLARAPYKMNCVMPDIAAFMDAAVRRVMPSYIQIRMQKLDYGFQGIAKRYAFEVPDAPYIDPETNEEKQAWDVGSGIVPVTWKPFVALAPEGCTPMFDDTSGEFAGIEYEPPKGGAAPAGSGAKKKGAGGSEGAVEIDIYHSEWVTNELHKTFGNMYGYPRTGYGYPYWWSYWFRWAVADRAFERKGDPAIVVRHPEGQIDLGDGDIVEANEYALMIADRLRAGAGIAMPSTPYYDFNDKPSSIREWEIEFLKGGIELDPFDKSFDYLDVMKLRSIWVAEQALIEGGGGTSSRNVAKEMYDGLVEAQSMEFMEIVDAFNRFYIPHLMQVNFPEAVDKGITCRMESFGFASEDTELINQIVQTVGQHDFTKLGVDVREALRRKNIPMLSQKQYEDQLTQAAESNNAPPATEPGRGDQTGVVPTQGVPPSTEANTPGSGGAGTATGFAYIAPRGWIDLSNEDALEFARDLPDTIHYQDSTVKALTKQLRAVWKRFYRDQYEDFAEFLETEDGALTLSSVTEEYALELSAEGDDIELAVPGILAEIAKRVVERWPVKQKQVDEVVKVSRDIIQKISDRAAKIAKRDVEASGEINEEEIQMWVDNHVGDVIPGIMRTTRNEVRDFVAKFADENDLLEEEKLPGQVRAHFSEFPEWKADRLARAESRDSFNAGYLLSGKNFGFDTVQAIDARFGDTDDHCERRDGQFFTVDQALREKEHPWGTLGYRFMKEEVGLSYVVPSKSLKTDVPGAIGHYSPEDSTIYFRADASHEDQRKLLLAVGDRMAV